MKLRAGIAATLTILAVVAVLVLVDKPEVLVAEDANQAQLEKNTEILLEPVILVKKKDLDMAKSVAEQAQLSEDKADEMCRKAQRDVREHSAQSSKAKRDAAIRAMNAFCKKVENVVTTEVAHDMEPLTGKAIVIHKKESKQVQDEKHLFKQTLGSLKFTGVGADKAAKQMATAHALQQMAGKALKPDEAKAKKACAEAHVLAEAKGGEHTPQGRKALAKVKVYCDKMENVVKNEKNTIMKEVKDMASGKAGSIAKQQKAAVATVQAQANQACTEAKEKAKKMASAAAMDMAKELCKKVESLVKKQEGAH